MLPYCPLIDDRIRSCCTIRQLDYCKSWSTWKTIPRSLRIISAWPRSPFLTSSFFIADGQKLDVRQRILRGRKQHPAARWTPSKGIQPGGVERRWGSKRDPHAAQDSHHTRYTNVRVSFFFSLFLHACHRARLYIDTSLVLETLLTQFIIRAAQRCSKNYFHAKFPTLCQYVKFIVHKFINQKIPRIKLERMLENLLHLIGIMFIISQFFRINWFVINFFNLYYN